MAGENAENLGANHIKAYIDLVSCKPFKKTSLPPLGCKIQNMRTQETSVLELSISEIVKRLVNVHVTKFLKILRQN